MMNDFSERERALLQFHLRYRVSTPAIVTAECFDGSESNAKKTLQRLREFIASDSLGGRNVYYRLSPTGAKLLGAPENIAEPLGPQALPRALGVLGFCCSGAKKRERYVRPEFLEDFPELAKDLLQKDYHTDYFLDSEDGVVRLGQIVVDLWGDKKKLISKCRVRFREYLDLPHIRDIAAEGLFSFGIVVAEEDKAEAIRLDLREKPLRARVIVEAVPELRKCSPVVEEGKRNVTA